MTRTIKELRILPPFAIARLGSADEPMDNYTIELDAPANQDQPLGYRALKPLDTLIVGERSGEIEDVKTPPFPLQFKIGGRIRPVAPFLEVFAVVESGKTEDGSENELVPLTVDLLNHNGLSVKDVSWTVSVANRKVARRTGDDNDVVATKGEVVVADHDIHALHGYCANFESPETDTVDFGQVRFIKPNAKHPEIRLRFTPARGLIYGPGAKGGQAVEGSHIGADGAFVFGVDDIERSVYDRDKGIWVGYPDPPPPPDVSAEAAARNSEPTGRPGATDLEPKTAGRRRQIRQRNGAARALCDQSAGAVVALRQCRDQSRLSRRRLRRFRRGADRQVRRGSRTQQAEGDGQNLLGAAGDGSGTRCSCAPSPTISIRSSIGPDVDQDFTGGSGDHEEARSGYRPARFRDGPFHERRGHERQRLQGAPGPLARTPCPRRKRPTPNAPSAR